MSLIVYIPEVDETGKRLQRMVGDLCWRDRVEIFYTCKRLDFRLRHPTGDEDMALLLLSTPKDLEELTTNRDLLSNLRLILILPDRERDTIVQAHLLRPRFIGYRDSDFSDVAMVLRKMKKTASPNPPLTQGGVHSPKVGPNPIPSFLMREKGALTLRDIKRPVKQMTRGGMNRRKEEKGE